MSQTPETEVHDPSALQQGEGFTVRSSAPGIQAALEGEAALSGGHDKSYDRTKPEAPEEEAVTEQATAALSGGHDKSYDRTAVRTVEEELPTGE